MRKTRRPVRPTAFEPDPRQQFRVAVFDEPRGEWRDSSGEARWDAINLGLASWDDEKREYYLAVPVTLQRRPRPLSQMIKVKRATID